MTRVRLTPEERGTCHEGGKWIPALCTILGTLMLLLVVVSCLPMVIARMTGYEVYNVVSGSMEPEIPVGSIIYVREAEPETVEADDIIAFVRDGAIVTHRVEENRYVEGEFVTKGDANQKEDMEPVKYGSLKGKVAFHVPFLGTVMRLLSGSVGKLYAALLILCGAMFHMLAKILRDRQN